MATTWTTRDGQIMTLDEMETSHLKNAMAMMRRNASKRFMSNAAQCKALGIKASDLLPEMYHRMEQELEAREEAAQAHSNMEDIHTIFHNKYKIQEDIYNSHKYNSPHTDDVDGYEEVINQHSPYDGPSWLNSHEVDDITIKQIPKAQKPEEPEDKEKEEHQKHMGIRKLDL